MKHFTSLCAYACIVAFFTIPAIGQPVCDFQFTSTTPAGNWYDKNGALYSPYSAGSQNWEIYTSTIGTPPGPYPLPYVLHTNPGSGNGSQSPRWLTSPQNASFYWTYNALQWSFWFGRGAGVGQNGSNNDGSIVWLYTNKRTGLDNVNTPGLVGLRVTWYHTSNEDKLRLSEIWSGTERVIGDFHFIVNLNILSWGTTVLVKRTPGGVPTGSTIRYQLWTSTKLPNDPGYPSSREDAQADPVAASTVLRVDTTFNALPSNPLVANPGSYSTGYFGFHSYYAPSRKNSAEYNQICFQDFGPTPVELNMFTARYRNDLVYLDWSTATETNNYGFEVQRSVEHDGSWKTIAFINGNGTSSSAHDYSYVDAPRFDGATMIAYRLKQIDRDGSFEFSNTILVTVAPRSSDVLYNFPNPFNPSTNIQFNISYPEVVTLHVYDEAGQRVRVLYDMEPLEAGFHTVSFSAEGLPAGSYFYRLSTIQETRTGAMILTK